MSLREDVGAIIRLQLSQTKLGNEAVQNAITGERSWGDMQAIIDMLGAYCTGLENALFRLADEIENLQATSGEAGS
jgi:hypothetical protein